MKKLARARVSRDVRDRVSDLTTHQAIRVWGEVEIRVSDPVKDRVWENVWDLLVDHVWDLVIQWRPYKN